MSCRDLGPSRLYGATCEQNAKISRWTGGPGPPGSSKIGIFGPKTPGDPSDDLGRSFGIIFSSKFQHPTMLVHHFHVFLENDFSENHENRTFRASLEPQAPRDPPYVQERQILFRTRIALTRALYDQTAPQLCPFYFPEKPSFSCLVFVLIFSPLENTSWRKGKLLLVQFI